MYHSPLRTTRLALALALSTLASLAGATPFAYIPNGGSNNVSVIDLANNTITATVPVGANPRAVGVSPTGTRAVVANFDAGTVSVLDLSGNTVVATVPVGSFPLGVAVNPAGTRAYVTSTGNGNVSVIDLASNTVVATVSVGSTPIGVAVNAAGTRAYVANQGSATLSVIDLSANTVIDTVPLGAGVQLFVGVAVNPAGTRAYVANSGSDKVAVIDLDTNTLVATVGVGNQPTGVAVNPAGTRAYVTNYGSGTVSVIDLATNTATSPLNACSAPSGVAVNPDGSSVYVACSGAGKVAKIDLSMGLVTANVTVGSNPYALGMFIGSPPPKASPTLSLTASPVSPGTAGQGVTFTATLAGGTGPTGQVTFKDGATTLCTVPAAPYTCAVSALAVGAHAITAAYAGDAGNNSASGNLSHTVNKAQPTLVLEASPSPSTWGQSVTLTATVTGGFNPTGTVTFSDGATTLCTVNAAPYTCVAPALTTGVHTLGATYAGDASNGGATASAVNQTVGKAVQAITGFTTTPATVVYTPGGQFTVQATGGASGNPVIFTSQTPAVCTVAPPNTVTMLGAGTCTIAANQAGDANHDAAPQLLRQVAIAAAPGANNPTPVPVLGPWALALLAGVLGLFGPGALRRRGA
jgi:YVTN family beta-propeller protein